MIIAMPVVPIPSMLDEVSAITGEGMELTGREIGEDVGFLVTFVSLVTRVPFMATVFRSISVEPISFPTSALIESFMSKQVQVFALQ